MKKINDMTLEELRYQANKVDWSQVSEYNQIDWVNDSLETIRAKLQQVLGVE